MLDSQNFGLVFNLLSSFPFVFLKAILAKSISSLESARILEILTTKPLPSIARRVLVHVSDFGSLRDVVDMLLLSLDLNFP